MKLPNKETTELKKIFGTEGQAMVEYLLLTTVFIVVAILLNDFFSAFLKKYFVDLVSLRTGIKGLGP